VSGSVSAVPAPGPLVALISATRAAIAPAERGFARQFPDASLWNIVDDRLLTEANRRGGVDEALAGRMRRLIDHALAEEVTAVLLTCSMYGHVAHRYHPPGVPVLAPDDAAFGSAGRGGFDRILVVASIDAAMRDTVSRLAGFLAEGGSRSTVTGVAAPEAFDAANDNDQPRLLAALADACAPSAGRVDAVLLAQYSLASAAARLSDILGLPVISGPDSAAAALRTATLEREHQR
jgi:phosphohistidine swiveling domain-containing protein